MPRSLLALARRDRRWRLALAVIGWPPIGYAAGTLAGQVTACAPSAPACAEPLQVVPAVLQLLVIVTLYLVPPAAAVASFAGLVALGVALPVAAVQSLAGDAGGGPVLGVTAAVAYVAALAGGVSSVWAAQDGEGTGRAGP